MRRFWFLILWPFLLSAANFEDEVEQAFQKYSDYNNVFLEKSADVLIDVVNDSVRISTHFKEDVLLLNENSKRGTYNSIYYSSFEAIKNIKACSYVPEGDKYRKYKVKDFETTNSYSNSVFYDDLKRIEVVYPKVKKGAVMTLEYDQITKDAHFLSGFIFQSYIPIVKAHVKVKIRKEIELNYQLFNTEGFDIETSQTESGDYWIYEWSLNDVEASKSGNRYAGWQYICPHVKFYLGEAKFKNRTETYFGNINDLHRYYYGFIKDLEVELDSALVHTVKEITRSCDSETDKVKAILYWIQNNVKYVAYEDGHRGFIPHDANYVFTKRYGDCKDIASVIIGMMRSVGIKGYYTWVGTRNIPYRYEELPILAVDNHMVATYFDNGTPVILDGTMDMYEYKMVPHHIQGKQVLISINKDSFRIEELPVTPLEQSSVMDSIVVNIDQEGVIKGVGKKSFSGYYRYEIATLLDGKTDERTQKSLEKSLQKGHNKFKLDSYHVSDYNNREQEVTIDYSFTVDDYVRILDDEIYVNLNLDESLKNLKIDTTLSMYPIENDFKGVEHYCCAFKIPDGYSVTYLPDDFTFTYPNFSVKISYSSNDSVVIQNKEIRLNFLQLEKNDFSYWDDMIRQLRRNYNKLITLSKT